MLKKVRIGVIGVGRMGERHIAVYQQLPGVEIKAIADTDVNRLREIATKYNIKQIYNDYHQLLEIAEIDAVSICTPDSYHKAPAIAAAEAGKHVLVEKPIATSLEDADAIIEAASKNHVLLMVGYTARFMKPFQYVKKVVDDGLLGDVIFARAFWYNAADIEGLSRIATRDSIITFLATHPIDLLLWYLGEVESVYCEAGNFVWSTTENLADTASISLRFKNKAIGHVGCTWAGKGAVYKVKFQVDIIGKEGVVEVNTVNETLKISSTKKGLELPLSYDPFDALRTELAHFIDCVCNNNTPIVTGEDGKKALEVTLAAIESAKSGKRVIM